MNKTIIQCQINRRMDTIEIAAAELMRSMTAKGRDEWLRIIAFNHKEIKEDRQKLAYGIWTESFSKKGQAKKWEQ